VSRLHIESDATLNHARAGSDPALLLYQTVWACAILRVPRPFLFVLYESLSCNSVSVKGGARTQRLSSHSKHYDEPAQYRGGFTKRVGAERLRCCINTRCSS
jgi:hypothetical protein